MRRHRHGWSVFLLAATLQALSGYAQDNASSRQAWEWPPTPTTPAPSQAPEPPKTPPAPPAQNNAPPAPIIEKGIPEQPPGATSQPPPAEAPVVVVPPAPPPPPPRLALLLPLKSRVYARAAAAVRDGYISAAERRPATERLPIWEYPVDDTAENLLATYERAVADGARVIVGPLTREGVALLAKSGRAVVPTLALNAVDTAAPLNPGFYMLALSLEAEARQAATLARRAGKCSAAVIHPDSALGRRLQKAFADEWLASQCLVLSTQALAAQPAPEALRKLRSELAAQPLDVVFIAGNADSVKRVRSYIKSSLPVYATSQVYRGKLGPGERREMRAVQFVDMPWLLQPDHPAVMNYPQPKKALGFDLQRFYALGVDAQRITQQILEGGEPLREPLDGVTGRLTRSSKHLLLREAVPAIYQDDGSPALLAVP